MGEHVVQRSSPLNVSKEAAAQAVSALGPWLHTRQTLLMRTPSPTKEGSDMRLQTRQGEDVEEHCGKRDSLRQQVSIPSKRLRSPSSPGIPEAQQDSQRYLVERRESLQSKKRQKRLASMRLPSTKPHEQMTRCFNFNLVYTETALRKVMEEYLPFRNEAWYWGGEPVLQFKSMKEVDEIQVRLTKLLNPLLAEGASTEIEIELRSDIKGKKKA